MLILAGTSQLSQKANCAFISQMQLRVHDELHLIFTHLEKGADALLNT